MSPHVAAHDESAPSLPLTKGSRPWASFSSRTSPSLARAWTLGRPDRCGLFFDLRHVLVVAWRFYASRRVCDALRQLRGACK